MRSIVFAAVGALLASPMAGAQVSRPFPGASSTDWSATQGRTVGAGQNVLTGEAGWPGIAVQYLHGIDSLTDAGVRLQFNYGFVNTTNSLTGVDLQVPVRRYLARTSSGWDIEGHVLPGFTIYGNNGSTLFGLMAPVGLTAGLKIDPKLTVSAGADVPLVLSVTNPFGFVFGPLVGAGGEFKIDRDLAVNAKMRIGPEFAFQTGGASSDLGFQALVGVAYAMR
ncbi:MAG: hypothetical protein ACJ784_07990 [Myxococcales bacterium]